MNLPDFSDKGERGIADHEPDKAAESSGISALPNIHAKVVGRSAHFFLPACRVPEIFPE